MTEQQKIEDYDVLQKDYEDLQDELRELRDEKEEADRRYEELLTKHGDLCNACADLRANIREQDERLEYYAGFYDAVHLIFDKDKGGKE